MKRDAVSLSMGDRSVPLETNWERDSERDHDLVGRDVEVSSFAGGSAMEHRGQGAKIIGVYTSFGVVVGYEVELVKDKSVVRGTAKDFFVERQFLEDIQPPTATSASIREALSHWAHQRDYWHESLDGLESLMFDLASVTPRALPEATSAGWRVIVPDPMPGDRTVVDCRAVHHDSVWSLATMVYPERSPVSPPPIVNDHWARVFDWTYRIASLKDDFPWDNAVKSLRSRAKKSATLLRPMVHEYMIQAGRAKTKLLDEPGSPVIRWSAGFSTVRLKAGTIGLNEPPSNRRPYTVISVSPDALDDEDYLRQVVIHECVHVVVASEGGEPHNDLFRAVGKEMGLKPEHMD